MPLYVVSCSPRSEEEIRRDNRAQLLWALLPVAIFVIIGVIALFTTKPVPEQKWPEPKEPTWDSWKYANPPVPQVGKHPLTPR